MKKLIFCVSLLFFCAIGYADFPCDYLKFSNIDKAQKITKGNGSVIAIIDWLFDAENKELKPYYYKPKSFTKSNFSRNIEPWHGYWMTQIAHAVAPEAKIIIIEAVENCSEKPDKDTCWKDNVNKALKYAADNGAAAISISHRAIKEYAARDRAINYAKKRGTLFIDIHYLGSNENVLIPTGSYKMVEPKSDVNVCEHTPFGYEEMKKLGGNPPAEWGGVSNTAPIVLGVVALVKSVNPKLTGLEIKKIIIDTAKNTDGKKVVDALAAVEKAKTL